MNAGNFTWTLLHRLVSRRGFSLFLLAGLAAGLSLCTSCKRGKPQVNSQYVQLFTLKKESDEEHTIEIMTSKGDKWFRPTKAVFDLDQCDYPQARFEVNEQGTYWVILPIREAFQDKLKSWSESHFGQTVGWFVNDQLFHVVEINKPIEKHLSISQLPNREVAEKLASYIQAGGYRKGDSGAP